MVMYLLSIKNTRIIKWKLNFGYQNNDDITSYYMSFKII